MLRRLLKEFFHVLFAWGLAVSLAAVFTFVWASPIGLLYLTVLLPLPWLFVWGAFWHHTIGLKEDPDAGQR